MLNCFYWYGFIWSGVFILYTLKFSKFSMELEPLLIVFFAMTIITSFILGYIYRTKLKFEYDQSKKLKTWKYSLPFFFLGALAEFVYGGQIPLVAIAVRGSSTYKEFSGIPIFHVLLTCASTYYAIKCFYFALCERKLRKKYLIHFLTVQFIYLLYFLRSQILFNLFCAGILTLAFLKSKNKIKVYHVISAVLCIVLVLYVFGGLGNLRSGSRSWNNSSYINELGLFDHWPDFLPEQFKWAYCYIVTPLSNLNYNIQEVKPSYAIMDFICELVPQTIAKRVLMENRVSREVLVRSYFTATTGYSMIYSAMGYLGLFLYQIYLNVITIVGIHISYKNRNRNRRTVFYSIVCLIYAYLFFTNTLYFVGTSFVLWIPFVGMMCKNRRITLNGKQNILKTVNQHRFNFVRN